MRATLLSCFAAFIAIFGLNGIFHSFVAAQLYDPHLHGIMLPMAQVNPLLIAFVDIVLVAAMAYFTLRRRIGAVQQAEAAKTGALIGLVGSWTFNLANGALIPGWPMLAAAVDVVWHVVLGAIGGMLMARVYSIAVAKGKP